MENAMFFFKMPRIGFKFRCTHSIRSWDSIKSQNRRLAICLAMVASGIIPTCSAADIHFITEPAGDGRALSPPGISARITEAALKFRRFAPVPRVTFYDMAMPKDVAEARQVGMNGLLLVTSVTQNVNDLPLNRVYVKTVGHVTELTKLTNVSSEIDTNDPVSVTFGRHRVDSLYLLPIGVVRNGSAVYTESPGNRGEFKICELTNNDNAFQVTLVLGVASSQTPSALALGKFIAREYPGFLAK